MNGFYDNPDKITFDEAERLVSRYIREVGKRRHHATAKNVATEFGLEQSHHNLIRINEAMDKKMKTVRESGNKATQYRIKEDG